MSVCLRNQQEKIRSPKLKKEGGNGYKQETEEETQKVNDNTKRCSGLLDIRS